MNTLLYIETDKKGNHVSDTYIHSEKELEVFLRKHKYTAVFAMDAIDVFNNSTQQVLTNPFFINRKRK